MSEDRYTEIMALVSAFEDLPDGAFMAAMEDAGVTVEELVEAHDREAEALERG